jgi:uncharacterized membrane protein YobD (UPF0266 family)
MLLAQALVERGLLDSMVTSIWQALMQVANYVGDGNNKWLLIGLALVMAFLFLRPRRR